MLTPQVLPIAHLQREALRLLVDRSGRHVERDDLQPRGRGEVGDRRGRGLGERAAVGRGRAGDDRRRIAGRAGGAVRVLRADDGAHAVAAVCVLQRVGVVRRAGDVGAASAALVAAAPLVAERQRRGAAPLPVRGRQGLADLRRPRDERRVRVRRRDRAPGSSRPSPVAARIASASALTAAITRGLAIAACRNRGCQGKRSMVFLLLVASHLHFAARCTSPLGAQDLPADVLQVVHD